MTISDTFLGVRSGETCRISPAGVAISTIRNRAGFAALRPEWDRLFRAVDGQPYSDHAYVDAWLESYGADCRIEVRIAREKGRLVGLLPLCRGPLFGARLPLAHDRSGLVGALLHPDLKDPQEVLGALLRCTFGSYQVLEPVEWEDATRLWYAARAGGLTAEIRQVFTASSVDLGDGIDGWRASLSKNARRSLTRAAKALEGAGSRWVTSADGQAAAAEAFLKAAESSWKAKAGTGFAGSSEGYAFIRALAVKSNPSALYFTTLFQGDTPVGGAFASVRGDTLYLNSVEFNESMAQAGPGRFVMCRVIEASAEMGLARVDMMRTSQLNQSVAKEERPLFRVTVHRRADPTVHLRRIGGLRRRLVRAGLQGLSPRGRHQAKETGDEV